MSDDQTNQHPYYGKYLFILLCSLIIIVSAVLLYLRYADLLPWFEEDEPVAVEEKHEEEELDESILALDDIIEMIETDPITLAPGVETIHTDEFSHSYHVGEDLPAGEYKIFSEADYGSMISVLDGPHDEEESKVTAIRSFYRFGWITVEEGEWLEVRDPLVFAENTPPPTGLTNGRYESGMYKVGYDIPEDTYEIIPYFETRSTYAIYDNSRDFLMTRDQDEQFSEPTTVTVSEGEYLYLNAAYIEEPEEE